jgi:hypothetical protein
MPFDSHGESIVPGLPYAIGRGTKKVISETRYDTDADILLVRRKGTNDPWSRVDEIDESLVWVPVDSYGIELPAGAEANSECAVDPSESVRSAILRAKALKDQIDAIEFELATDLGAHGDSELMDAIMQAVQGDGTADKILQLVGAIE